MTCKVRRDFKIITDVLSRVSLVTSNIRGSSICSPKSLYKKTSNAILGRVEGSCQNGCVKGCGGPDPSYPSLLRPICCDRRVSNSQISHTPRHHREEGRRKNFLSCSDHSWMKTTAIFFPLPSRLSISFSADFLLYSTKRWSYGTKIVSQTGLFSFGMVNRSKRRKNSEFKHVKFHLRINLVLHPARAEGLGKYIHWKKKTWIKIITLLSNLTSL